MTETLGQGATNIFERQRTEPELPAKGGPDSKHSTFSFNNQPQIFSHTLTKGIPSIVEEKN